MSWDQNQTDEKHRFTLYVDCDKSTKLSPFLRSTMSQLVLVFEGAKWTDQNFFASMMALVPEMSVFFFIFSTQITNFQVLIKHCTDKHII